jgi:hypothetical protein
MAVHWLRVLLVLRGRLEWRVSGAAYMARRHHDRAVTPA